MKFTETPLPGAYLVELNKLGDERGFFARYYCKKEYAAHGLDTDLVQINTSLSAQKGTLRGMHFQYPPHAETKVVRCLRGSIYDVIVDLRAGSPTYGKWYGAELTAENRLMLLVPKGFAHGFITLEDDTEILYLVSAYYAPEAEGSLHWNDPQVGIEWPLTPQVVSEKDQKARSFDELSAIPVEEFV